MTPVKPHATHTGKTMPRASLRTLVATWIQYHLTAKGLTQGELAERSGISRQTISEVVNEKRDPEDDTIAQLATAFGVEPPKIRLDTELKPKHMGALQRPSGDSRVVEGMVQVLEGAVVKALQDLMVQNELHRSPGRKRAAVRALKDLARQLRALGADVSDLLLAIDQVEEQWPDIEPVK